MKVVLVDNGMYKNTRREILNVIDVNVRHVTSGEEAIEVLKAIAEEDTHLVIIDRRSINVDDLLQVLYKQFAHHPVAVISSDPIEDVDLLIDPSERFGDQVKRCEMFLV